MKRRTLFTHAATLAALATPLQMRYFLLRFGRVENRFEFRLGEESPNSTRRDAAQPAFGWDTRGRLASRPADG